MSRAYEEAQEQRLHQHVAAELGISPDDLDAYPYQIEENSSDDGVVYGWRVTWDDGAPEGVQAHGEAGSMWSNISQHHEPEEPEDRD